MHPNFPAEMRSLCREVLGHLNRANLPYVAGKSFDAKRGKSGCRHEVRTFSAKASASKGWLK